jgi:hypothetical protein
MKTLLALFAVLAAGAQVALGDYVSNGDFEIGSRDGWTSFTAPETLAAIVSFDVYGGDGASHAFQVNPTFAAVGTVATLSQSLRLDAGTSYTVSWEQGMQNVGPYLNSAGAIEMRLGGQLLSRWSQGVLGANGYAGLREEKLFTPTVSDVFELHFRFVREAGSYDNSTVFMYVDNVSVKGPATVVVPAPSSLACLLSVGVMVFGGRWLKQRRRRTRSAT